MNRLADNRFARLCMAAAAVLLCAGSGGAAERAESAQAKAKLVAVRARIAALTSRLGTELKQRDTLNARLRESELAITEKRRHLEALRASQSAAERRRAELLAEQTRQKNDLRAERASLAAQVRSAYMIGHQEELKLLLNQSSPAALGRTLAYYSYFAQERTVKIEAIKIQVLKLDQLVTDIDTQSARLKALQEEAGKEMGNVQRARAERTEALAALTNKLAGENRELGELKREEQAVESLVADLARVLQDLPNDPNKSFEHMRGKLPWPVQGRISARYQSPRANSAGSMRWNGVMIDTARGAKIRAPYFGRVVYADWLQGLGLLIIIAHSGGYMSLYGHAEVLYKAVGDTVVPGDILGALSDAEGAGPQLYFEIRAGRKTVDPRIWLRTAP